MAEKYLDYSGVELLWQKIKQLVNKKLDNVKPADKSINVKNSNEISANISKSEGNLLSVKQDGLYSERPVLHKLTFGAKEEYTYDGTEDVTVPVYDGKYE